jgi:hypothetical protein
MGLCMGVIDVPLCLHRINVRRCEKDIRTRWGCTCNRRNKRISSICHISAYWFIRIWFRKEDGIFSWWRGWWGIG